jgi:hypothetical protein
MYYELGSFYKRDTSFVYSEEKNPVSWLKLRNGERWISDNPIVYNVDKIDSYINDYDILPTIGILLVSEKFKNLFDYLEKDNQIQFSKAAINDKKGVSNSNFYALNILNVIPCLDKDSAVFDIEVDEDDGEEYYIVKKMFIQPNSLDSFSIVRMKENDSYIIVTKDFKNKCENMKLKGFNFREEGHSIYKDL